MAHIFSWHDPVDCELVKICPELEDCIGCQWFDPHPYHGGCLAYHVIKNNHNRLPDTVKPLPLPKKPLEYPIIKGSDRWYPDRCEHTNPDGSITATAHDRIPGDVMEWYRDGYRATHCGQDPGW